MNHDEYRSIARWYDGITAAYLREPRRALADLCLEMGAARVLDVGCGTGAFLAMLRERVPFAVGLDASRAMLARARCPQFPRRAVAPLVLGAGEHPPFAAQSFDAVVFAMVLHESEAGAERLLNEAFTLSPLALVLDWRVSGRWRDILAAPWIPVIERLAGKRHYRSFCRFRRAGGLRGLARRTGAVIVRERVLNRGALVLAALSR